MDRDKPPGFDCEPNDESGSKNKEKLNKKKKSKKKKKAKKRKRRKSIEKGLVLNNFRVTGYDVSKDGNRVANFIAYIKSSDLIMNQDKIASFTHDQTVRTEVTFKICLKGEWQKKVIKCDYDRLHQDFASTAKRLFGNEIYITHDTTTFKMFLNALAENTKFTKKNVRIAKLGFFKHGSTYHHNDGSSIIPPVTGEVKYLPLRQDDNNYGIKKVDVDPRDAYRENIKFLSIGEELVTHLSWGYFISALLLPLFDSADARMRSTLFYYGESGSRKTSVALYLSSLTNLNSSEIDCNFGDSDTYMQIMLHSKNCGIALFDDQQPGISNKAMQEASDKIEKVLRAVSDGNARKRSTSSLTKNQELRPRALACITSELQPANSVSSTARMIPLEIKRDTFNLKKLSKRQARIDIASTGVHNFLVWALNDFDKLSKAISEYFTRKRIEMRAFDAHGKIKDACIVISMAFSIHISMGISRGYVTVEEAKELIRINESVINDYLHKSNALMSGRDPIVMYLNAVNELIDTKKMVIKPLGSSQTNSQRHDFETNSHFYLMEGLCFAEVKKYWRNQSINFGLRSSDIYKLMLDKRIIEVNQSEVGKVYTKKVKVYADSENRVRTLVINKDEALKYVKATEKSEQLDFVFRNDFIKNLENLYQFKFKSKRKG